jgi:acyl-ACP thioesterase
MAAVLSSAPMETRREQFPVHGSDADAFGLLTGPALAGYLSEIAGHHAEALGVGIEALRARGQGWVLLRTRIEVASPVAAGDLLEVETWPSGASRLWALRDFRIRRAGIEVARAITTWLVIDLASRRPVRPDRVLAPALHAEQEHALPPPEEKIPALAAHDLERAFEIRYLDIDRNLHVTNTSYLAWALEAVPQETWSGCRLAGLEADYQAECRYGSRVVSRAAALGEGAFLHAVVREEDGKELCRLRTRWVVR